MVCSTYPQAFGPAQRAGALTKNALGAALPLPLLGEHRRPVPGRPVRLLQRPGQPPLPGPPRRGDSGRLRRLDGGLRRVHAARRALSRRHARRADAQPLPRPLPPLVLRVRPPPAAADRGLHPLGLHRGAPIRAAGVGRRPHHQLRLRRPGVGAQAGAHHGPVGHLALGLGHRRLLRPGSQPPHPGAAPALDRAGRRVGDHAHRGQRRRPSSARPAADRRPRSAAGLAPLGQAAHAALPLPRVRRRALPAHRGAAHAPPQPHASGRPGGALARRPVHVRPGPDGRPGGARRRAQPLALPPARPLGRPVALPLLRPARRRPAAGPRSLAERRPRGDAARAARGAAPPRPGRRADPAPPRER